jgi:hypothetical protein
MADKTKAVKTPRMVSEWLRRRPTTFPPRVVPKMPANTAPSKGAMGTASKVDAESVALIVVISLILFVSF